MMAWVFWLDFGGQDLLQPSFWKGTPLQSVLAGGSSPIRKGCFLNGQLSFCISCHVSTAVVRTLAVPKLHCQPWPPTVPRSEVCHQVLVQSNQSQSTLINSWFIFYVDRNSCAIPVPPIRNCRVLWRLELFRPHCPAYGRRDLLHRVNAPPIDGECGY